MGWVARQNNIYIVLGIASIILALQLLDQLFLFLLVELFTVLVQVFRISKCLTNS